ncbi:1-phosphofructokinase family hexose kinase [Microbacterium ginsengiterrae]|uniref:1-phosphofructokinase family hexose kinase n=1 Tax=Microbacterium ginsengiterrae TaxID=546115 RepID=A0A7W9CCD6_9MICO|nr:1-phosphofructokinase family hexose kinase [Microbacterium ginsengiterrae]
MTARFVTVTPNPAVDVTYTVDGQTVGETLRVRDVRRLPGGKGLNVARVLTALGRDVVALQPLGGDAGRWMTRAIAGAGLASVPCPIEGETRTTVAVVDGMNHPTLLAEPGPTLTSAEWSRLAATVAETANPGDWVVIAGSFPPASRAEHLELIVDAAHDRGALVAVDTSGEMLRAAVGARADLIKANEGEILDATGADDAVEGMGLLSVGGATVMMSRGADGSVLREPGGSVIEQQAVPGIAGNPTGAGDASTAGLVAALAEGHSTPIALAWAAICGAAAVLRPGAGEIDPDVLPELAQRLAPVDGALDPLHQKRSQS